MPAVRGVLELRPKKGAHAQRRIRNRMKKARRAGTHCRFKTEMGDLHPHMAQMFLGIVFCLVWSLDWSFEFDPVDPDQGNQE